VRCAAHDGQTGFRSAPAYLADRCFLRPQGKADYLGGMSARSALYSGAHVQRISPHRVSYRGDAVAGIPGVRTQGCRHFVDAAPPIRFPSKLKNMNTRVLTGITTTSTPHLRNYAGTIRPPIQATTRPDIGAINFITVYPDL